MAKIKSWHVVGFILLVGAAIYVFVKNRPKGSVILGDPTVSGAKVTAAGGYSPTDSLIPGAKYGTTGYDSEFQ